MLNVTISVFPKNKKLFLWGGVLFLFFLFLTFLETKSFLSGFDFWATKSLQTLIPRNLDVPLSFFSLLGSFEVTIIFVLALTLITFKRGGLIPYVFILFGLVHVVELLGKLLLFHPNPPHYFFRYKIPFNFPSVYVQTGYSFPSGHVSRTIFLTVAAIGFFKNKSLTIFCWLISIIMILSRIYLGEHWASDTIGGLLLGGSMGLFAVSYL